MRKIILIFLGIGIFVFTTTFLFKFGILSQPYFKITDCIQWGVKIPDKFPQDVPIYKSSRLISSFVDCEDDKQRIIVALITPDELSRIQNFYKGEMINNQWVDKGISEYPTVKILNYTKDERVLEIRLEQYITPIQVATFGQFKNLITITYSIPQI